MAPASHAQSPLSHPAFDGGNWNNPAITGGSFSGGDLSGGMVTPSGSASTMTERDAANLPCARIDLFGADPSGTNFSDDAYSHAMALAPLHHGCVQFGGGLYKFASQTPWPFLTTGTSRALVRGIGSAATALYWPNAAGGLLFAEHSDHHSFAVEGVTLLTGQGGTTEAILATNDFSSPGSSSCPGSPYHSEIRDVSIQGYDRFARTGAAQFWKTGVHTTNVSFLNWDGLNVTDADPAVFTNPNETGVGMLLEGTAPGTAYPQGCLAGVFNGSRSGY